MDRIAKEMNRLAQELVAGSKAKITYDYGGGKVRLDEFSQNDLKTLSLDAIADQIVEAEGRKDRTTVKMLLKEAKRRGYDRADLHV